MTVQLYRSTDASAPVLTGVNGSLATVLDAVLVNGYGSQSAAGWTIAYSGTNTRQYQMGAGGTDMQMFVNDAGPGAGLGREAFFCGFRTGTGIGTGTGQFPTTAIHNIGIGQCVIRKSQTADAVARPWYIIANQHTIYMFVETGDFIAPIQCYPWMFGDFTTYSQTDLSNCTMIGRITVNSGAMIPTNVYGQGSLFDAFGHLGNCGNGSLGTTFVGHVVAGSQTNLGGGFLVGKHTDSHKMGVTSNGQMGLNGVWTTGTTTTANWYPSTFYYPNSPDGGLYTAPVWMHHTGTVRGYYRGLWCPLQTMPLNHLDTYSGTGNLSGRSFIAINLVGLNNQFNGGPSYWPCQVHMEYSDTWN